MRRILITSLALCTAALSAACSDSACDSDLVAGGMAMVRAVPQSVTAEAAYAHRVCLIREGVVAQSVSAASAATLAPFRVEPGTYGMLASEAEVRKHGEELNKVWQSLRRYLQRRA